MPDGLLASGSYSFSWFALPTLLTALGLLVLGVAVLLRERVSSSSRLFSVLVALISIWLLAFSAMYSTTSAGLARWWAKAAYLGLPFIPAALYHFTVLELGIASRRKKVVVGAWTSGAIFSALALLTDALVAQVRPYSWGFYPQYGWLGAFYLLFFFGTILAAFNHYRLAYLATKPGIQRRRIRHFMFAFGIGCLASVDYLPKYGIAIYPLGYLAVIGFLVLAAQGIWRYRLIRFTPAFAAEEILSTMQGAVVVTDLEGRIQLINHSASELLEYGESEIKGLPMTLIVEAAGQLPAALIEAGGRIRDRKFVWRRKTGEPVDVSASATVLRDKQGDAQGFVYVAYDITERLRAEAKLHEQSEALEALIYAAPVGILSLDLEGRVTRWNAAAERIFGCSQQEVLGAPPPFTLEETTVLDALQTQVVQGRSLTGIELDCRRRDDSSLTIALSAAPLRDSMGSTVGIMAVVMDVTAQRQLEAQLQESQKMEALGRLAGGIAHDFNNILFVINGYAELLLGTADVLPRHREAIEQIRQAGTRAADLTRQLLAFSRRQVVQPTLLDLNVVVAEAAKMLQRVLGEDVVLTIVAAKDLALIRGDRGQIEQILMNLCVNARDAMPQGGRLVIETANVTLNERPLPTNPPLDSGAYVTCTVRDSGCGMSPAVQSRMFEPFFTTKDQGKGTGLGLSIVYGIVTQHNGAVAVESQVGIGTTIRVFFPRVADRATLNHVPQPGTPVLGGHETVLLVEDETGVRHLLRQTLEQYGYSVLEAPNGLEAVAMAELHEGALDILVTDMVMPYMSGPEVAERLVRRRPTLKVIYMSGYVDEEVRTKAAVTPHAFLQKPFPPLRLAEEIRHVMAGAS